MWNFFKIKSINSLGIWSCNGRKQNSFGLHLLDINFLNHTLFVVWTREENWILKTERALFSNKTLKSFVTKVAVLLFVLMELFDRRLRVVSQLVSAVALRSLLSVWRITRNLKAFWVTFFTRDIQISKDITFDRFKGMTCVSIFRKIHVGIHLLLFSCLFIYFLRFCFLSVLNIF